MCVFYFASHLLLVVWSSIKGFLTIDLSNFFSVGNRAGGYAVQPLITFKIAEFSTHTPNPPSYALLISLSTMRLSRKCERRTNQDVKPSYTCFPTTPHSGPPRFGECISTLRCQYFLDHPSKWIVGKTGLNYYRTPSSVNVMYRVILWKPQEWESLSWKFHFTSAISEIFMDELVLLARTKLPNLQHRASSLRTRKVHLFSAANKILKVMYMLSRYLHGSISRFL